MFSEQLLSFSSNICSLLTAAPVQTSDSAWLKNWKFLNFPHWFFFFFPNLSESGRESGLLKKMGVTDHKLQAKLTQWLPFLNVLRKFSQRLRLMHDMIFRYELHAQ